MSDNDDPFKPSDATVLRPRPGGGRRPSGPPATRGPGSPQGYADSTSFGPRPGASTEPISSSLQESLGAGLNPLVRVASPLLMLAGQLRGSLSAPDISGLRRLALDEIRRFEDRARASGIQNEVILAARYALCAGVDEAVLSTPWGAQSEWAQQTLLVALHREAQGGEKFFEMLDRISGDPARHIDLMELQYLCVALGFAGKYQVVDRGHAQLAEVQHDLYRRIRNHRGVPQPELSLRWRGLQDRRNPVIRYVPWWVVGAAALAIIGLTFVVYYARLGSAAGPVHASLAGIGLEDFTTPRPAVVIPGPTLKQLLKSDDDNGALRVQEDGGLTRITLLAPDLFASASATLNPSQTETVKRVASAINQVPGRVLVEGHTDDQPLRSLKYRDNFELSRERAVTVARILQSGLDNPARVEWNGVGDTKPLHPEPTRENRARNRRVEIVHVRGT